MKDTDFSFPGIGLEEKMMVSPFFTWIILCSEFAIRVRADIGSPWLPVVMMTTLSSSMVRTLPISIMAPFGIFIYPSSLAVLTTLSMLRPERATFRPFFTAASMIFCTRYTFDANVAMMIRDSVSSKMLSRASPTRCSEGVKPFRMTLVLSAIISSTPSPPSVARRWKLMVSPSSGV